MEIGNQRRMSKEKQQCLKANTLVVVQTRTLNYNTKQSMLL